MSLRCDPHAVVPAVPGVVAVDKTQRNRYGLPVVFAVRAMRDTADCRPASLLVQVPRRPTGATRWTA